MVEPRTGPATARLPDGKVLVVGGYSGSEYLKSAEVFDPKTETFEALAAEMTEARYAPVIAPTTGGDLLISGGENSWPFVRSAELFDPATGKFEAIAAKTVQEREGAVATPLAGGKVLIAGGYKPSGTVNTAEIFNPTTKEFESFSAHMAQPRFAPAAALLPDGKLLIAGGINAQSGVSSEPLGSAEVFNPTTEHFSLLHSEMAEPREGASAALLPGGKVLIVGGGAESNGAGQTAEVFNPVTKTFEKLAAELAQERSLSSSVALPDGDILIVGGDSTFGPPLRTAELASGSAALIPSFTWSGRSEVSSEASFDWSLGANWQGGTAPSANSSVGTLAFPRLASPTCATEVPADACYFGFNDLTGLSAEAMRLDTANNYVIAGNEIALGPGGLDAAPASGPVGPSGDVLEAPLRLSGAQKWSIAGRGSLSNEAGLLLAGGIGGASPLEIGLSEEPVLYFAENDTEVGPLAITGADPTRAGVFNGVVALLGARLNSSGAQTVHLSHVLLLGSGAVGSLLTSGAEVEVGSPAQGIEATSAIFDPASRLEFNILGEGAAPKVDYSQLVSEGAIQLGGAKLELVVRPPTKGARCPTLARGHTYTFISTTGGISGAFANAPAGGPELPLRFAEACPKKTQTVQIAYRETGTTQTVTGTVEERAVKGEEEAAGRRLEEEAAGKRRLEEEAAGRRRLEEEAAARRKLEEALAKVQQGPASGASGPGQGVAGSTTSVAPVVPDARVAASDLWASSAGNVRIKVSCPTGEPRCLGTLTLRTLTAVAARPAAAKRRAAVLTLGTVPFSIAGGKTATVVLHLASRARLLLTHMHRLRVRVTIVAHDLAGARHVGSATVTLRAARVRRGG